MPCKSTQQMYSELSPMSKADCRDTLALCKLSGNCAPDELDRIVRSFYDFEFSTKEASNEL